MDAKDTVQMSDDLATLLRHHIEQEERDRLQWCASLDKISRTVFGNGERGMAERVRNNEYNIAKLVELFEKRDQRQWRFALAVLSGAALMLVGWLAQLAAWFIEYRAASGG